MQYTNFANEDIDNPFQPPITVGSRQANPTSPVTSSTGNVSAPLITGRIQDSGLNDYNPFDKVPATLPASGGDTLLGGMGTSPPPYLPPGSKMGVSVDELERRQKELEAREAELRAREEELRQRAYQTGQNGAGNPTANNWPPLPSFLPIGPCFYQDIEVDIAVEYRRIVQHGYYLWLGHCLVFLYNIVAAVAYLAGSKGSSDAGSTFGLSIIFALLFIPSSYVCWFRPLYKAFKNDSSFYFFFFFIVFSIQIVVLILQGFGISFFAGCGWINGIGVLAANTLAGLIMLISAIGFTALVILNIVLLLRVHRIYRGTGASFEKAKQEFSRGLATNPTTLQAGASVLTSGLSNAASSLRY